MTRVRRADGPGLARALLALADVLIEIAANPSISDENTRDQHVVAAQKREFRGETGASMS